MLDRIQKALDYIMSVMRILACNVRITKLYIEAISCSNNAVCMYGLLKRKRDSVQPKPILLPLMLETINLTRSYYWFQNLIIVLEIHNEVTSHDFLLAIFCS